MSLLDDARKMLDEGPPDWHKLTKEWICGFCYERLFDPTNDDDDDPTFFEAFTHAPDCSWLSMPKIVAALEAAERTLDNEMGVPEHDDGTCWFCDQGEPQKRDLQAAGHVPDCPWRALVAALQGEPA